MFQIESEMLVNLCSQNATEIQLRKLHFGVMTHVLIGRDLGISGEERE